jgi:VIT1/CCC1 family predicted Fe2+/Mn2+ transporter
MSPTRRPLVVRLILALAVLMPSNASQKCSSNRTEPREDQVPYQCSASCSEESVDAAALFLFNVFASGIVIPVSPSASTATAASAAISTFVVFIVVALVVFIFAATVDGLVLM